MNSFYLLNNNRHYFSWINIIHLFQKSYAFEFIFEIPNVTHYPEALLYILFLNVIHRYFNVVFLVSRFRHYNTKRFSTLKIVLLNITGRIWALKMFPMTWKRFQNYDFPWKRWSEKMVIWARQCYSIVLSCFYIDKRKNFYQNIYQNGCVIIMWRPTAVSVSSIWCTRTQNHFQCSLPARCHRWTTSPSRKPHQNVFPRTAYNFLPNLILNAYWFSWVDTHSINIPWGQLLLIQNVHVIEILRIYCRQACS